MAGMAGHGWIWLRLELDKMTGHERKWLKFDGDGWKWLEMAGYVWKWLEMTGMAGNGKHMLEMA